MPSPASLVEPAGPLPSHTTPAGLQTMAELRRRRLVVIALNLSTYAALMAGLAVVLGAGGWSIVDLLILACVAVAAPWTVLGFWNAAFGLWLLHGAADGLQRVAPFARAGDADEPLRLSTAVLMTLRNEDPARAMARLRVVKESLDAAGHGHAFAYFILSDTSRPEVAAAEETAVETWRRSTSDPERIVYRRRATNEGFKAGNVRDFLERWGDGHDLMLPLDADSLMTRDAIVRLVRMMQAHPRLGILQSLVVGAPSRSAFARIFQFGMRAGMRAYTFGSAWWIGECGPFWGHNALVRIAPFKEHCHLPVLPGGPPLGGAVLSHDQVEATLMRKAGYEVRVLPLENGSYEENPPTLFDFSVRDLRWCQGNLQYLRLLDLPGLLPMSRFQLVWAILMFLGVPAMTLLVALAPLKLLDGEDPAAFPGALAAALYVAYLLMYLSPKLAGLADVLLTPGGVRRYGGAGRFLAGAAVEIAFSFLVGAVTTFRLTLFMGGLLVGRSIAWDGQTRDAYGIAWGDAARGLWGPTLFGLAVGLGLAVLSPAALLWSLPLTLGYLVAIPFTVLTASPAMGERLTRWGLCAVPEEIDMPPELAAVRAG
ncbi:glucans biosynthesis glucosyltransferase MdoH [Salinarimonas soli]|uniref:Glucans biosynthesis glucosyltransferase H n=2 Tax=Salinarimonas soli TaxID=1638099 RepID=A0A5B2VVR7_9HYPH|nr:glucans biosynthesis glucosyltransferase MdoH [Salinarimonas soli]